MMKIATTVLILLAGLAVAGAPATASPVPLFDECPALGSASGCSYLVELGAGNSTALLFDNSAKDVDNSDDVLVGILNNSGHYINFQNFLGPNNAFSSVHLPPGLDNGKSFYFETKDPFENDGKGDDGDDDDGQKCLTPEPGSLLLLATGMIAMWGMLRHSKACQRS